jgi:hypothetical protein
MRAKYSLPFTIPFSFKAPCGLAYFSRCVHFCSAPARLSRFPEQAVTDQRYYRERVLGPFEEAVKRSAAKTAA